MRFRALALEAAILVGVFALAACSGTAATQGNSPEGGAPDGRSSGEPPLGGDDPVPTTNAAKVVVGSGFCGGAPGKCNDRSSFTVDLAASSLEISTCVEGGDGGTSDSTSTRPIDATQLAKIRAALDTLRFRHSALTSIDGHMDYVSVTDTAGTTRRYSPEAACGGDYDKIVAGFSELSVAIRGR